MRFRFQQNRLCRQESCDYTLSFESAGKTIAHADVVSNAAEIACFLEIVGKLWEFANGNIETVAASHADCILPKSAGVHDV